MPTPRASAERLATVLARRAGVRAADLAAALGVSVPTLHRLIKACPTPVLAAGRARRTRYALRRTLRGGPGELPLYAVDASGHITQVAGLTLVAPAGCHMMLADTGWPVPEESRDGWWEGLPYPLYDLRPQGFMGRQLARAVHRELAVSEDPRDWGDDDLLWVLSRAGSDLTGNLILGDIACARFQETCLKPPEPLRGEALAPGYAALAETALAGGLAGSSLAGECPKFTALRDLPGVATPHVLVKFAGADGSPAVTRWADLLRAEHLALGCAGRLPGVTAAASRLLEGGRADLPGAGALRPSRSAWPQPPGQPGDGQRGPARAGPRRSGGRLGPAGRCAGRGGVALGRGCAGGASPVVVRAAHRQHRHALGESEPEPGGGGVPARPGLRPVADVLCPAAGR